LSDRTLQLLLVSDDATTRAEVAEALHGLRGASPALHVVGERAHAVEVVRSRRPDVVLIELGPDLDALLRVAAEVEEVAPEACLVALYPVSARYGGEPFGEGVRERDVMLRLMRSRIEDVLQRPVSAPDLAEVLERVDGARRPARRAPVQGRIVTFTSNKGGVGKSTMAVSAAVALAVRHPERVLLVDASFQLGTCASTLDLDPVSTIVDAVRQRTRLDETLLSNLALVHESGLHLLAAPEDAIEAQEVDEESLLRVLNVARRTYELVVVDTYPMLEGLVISILDMSDAVCCVTQPTVPVVRGMDRFLGVLERLGIPRSRQRVILNQTHPRFPSMLAPRDVAERLERDLDHVIPFQKGLMTALNTGRPYVLTTRSRWWGFGKAVDALVRDLEALRPEAPDAAAARNGGDRGEETVDLEGAALEGRLPGRGPDEVGPADYDATGWEELADSYEGRE